MDTNVVSALRVRGRNPLVETWAASVSVADQFVTALTISELERGVIAKERSAPAQGAILRRWFDGQVLPAFADRVLPFELPAPRILCAYRVPERAPLDDALIAAIAQAEEMTVATRNTRHFEPVGSTSATCSSASPISAVIPEPTEPARIAEHRPRIGSDELSAIDALSCGPSLLAAVREDRPTISNLCNGSDSPWATGAASSAGPRHGRR